MKTQSCLAKKIVVNNALQHLRISNAHTFITTEPSEIPDTPSAMEHPLLEEKSAFIYDFTHQELLSSIDSLPPHHKSVFNLYFIENYSHAEISDVLGITVNTSKSHLLRAKKSIQNYLLNHVVNQNTPKRKPHRYLYFLALEAYYGLRRSSLNFRSFQYHLPDRLRYRNLQVYKIMVMLHLLKHTAARDF
jgi:predicted DNA-binding protein YlxM (UPF0122 family)